LSKKESWQSMNRPIKLFTTDGKLITELELPREFRLPPTVIFYGARAFHSILIATGNYTECSCWRAAQVEEKAKVAS
jgi:sugar lactone lactonase YvrE